MTKLMYHGTSLKNGLLIGKYGEIISPAERFLRELNTKPEEEFIKFLLKNELKSHSREDAAYEFTSRYFMQTADTEAIYFSPIFSFGYANTFYEQSSRGRKLGLVLGLEIEPFRNKDKFIKGFMVYRQASLDFLREVHMVNCDKEQEEQVRENFKRFSCSFHLHKNVSTFTL